MVDKKGNFNFSDFDLNKASDLIDDKMARNITENVIKHLGPNAL